MASPTVRVTKSPEPPGGYPTTKRKGLWGKGCALTETAIKVTENQMMKNRH
jgi:hypothetical protein